MHAFSPSRRTRRRRPSPTLRLESLEGRILLTAGDLDATFGVAGVVTGNYGMQAPGPNSIVVQVDGKEKRIRTEPLEPAGEDRPEEPEVA